MRVHNPTNYDPIVHVHANALLTGSGTTTINLLAVTACQ
jgi:hypothetical protein